MKLAPTTTAADLVGYFAKFGPITKAVVITDKVTGESRGFGFVTFADTEAFEGDLLKVCHFLNGRKVSVKPANLHTRSRVIRF
ncbi:unnamed protein product [Dibothriocephalus latus]|uniref:RRM domain-containing protein n=1 Tax=Dibothriocephalus latus TaxID=60516 RepID=A0A3P7LGE8_DIBLA|nr:unnamed protein product [Dibothriocephalus latus]